MATDSTTTRVITGVDWRRAEFVLTLLAFLGFITVAIKITTVYAGLPAHPLIVHVPVVLIPLSIIGALACVSRPAWFGRYGILLCSMAIVAMSSIFLAMQALARKQDGAIKCIWETTVAATDLHRYHDEFR